ncbi:hypothetical protein Cgig2_011329 [Carnegiea gigantea]|uniref:Uncharacterized protein n=1 Tax=Carnegiea gigantea TaxID=171969 RepID=A0A9Q1QHM9_9CARY|nr:hypothetical protein Cgig2_011329 [Carnegiea gigantea]
MEGNPPAQGFNLWPELDSSPRCYQEFPKEFCEVLMPMPVALMLGLSHPLSSRGSLGLYFGVGFFQLTLQVPPSQPFRRPSPSSASGACTWLSILPTFGAQPRGHQSGLAEGHQSSREGDFSASLGAECSPDLLYGDDCSIPCLWREVARSLGKWKQKPRPPLVPLPCAGACAHLHEGYSKT